MKSRTVAIIAFAVGLCQYDLAYAGFLQPTPGLEAAGKSPDSSQNQRERSMGIFRSLQGAVTEGNQELAHSLAVQLVSLQPSAERASTGLSAFEMVYVGDVLSSLGAHENALEAYEAALALLEYTDQDAEFLVDVLERFASALHDNRRFSEAENHWQRAIGLRQKELPVHILKLAGNFQGLALTFVARQRAGDAFPLLERSVSMVERRYGPNHPSLIGFLQNQALTAAMVANGIGAGAERVRFNGIATARYKRALELAVQAGDTETYRADAIRQNLGIHLLVLERYQEAEPLLLQALDRAESLAGSTSLAALTPASELGILMKETARFPEAEAYARQAVEIAAMRLPGSDVEIIILNNMAALLLETNRPTDAMQFARQGATSEIVRRSKDTRSARAAESDARIKDARIFEASIGSAWSVQILEPQHLSGEKS